MARSSHNSDDRLLAYAFWLLGRRDYTEAEMLTKLNKKMVGSAFVTGAGLEITTSAQSELVGGVMHRLRELGYVNDRAFAERFAQKSLSDRSRGRFWVQQQLRKKGIASDVIDDALGLLQEDAVFEACLRAGEVKFKNLVRRRAHLCSGIKLKQALFRFLAGRGFEIRTIERVISRVMSGFFSS